MTSMCDSGFCTAAVAAAAAGILVAVMLICRAITWLRTNVTSRTQKVTLYAISTEAEKENNSPHNM